ncbi:MAG: hypothetical protein QOH75_2872 [Actinomycetota bacterium]|nr:hypothetical protein [Actinomycetota bacterium]
MHNQPMTLLSGEPNNLRREVLASLNGAGVGLEGDVEVRVDEETQRGQAGVPRLDHPVMVTHPVAAMADFGSRCPHHADLCLAVPLPIVLRAPAPRRPRPVPAQRDHCTSTV